MNQSSISLSFRTVRAPKIRKNFGMCASDPESRNSNVLTCVGGSRVKPGMTQVVGEEVPS